VYLAEEWESGKRIFVGFDGLVVQGVTLQFPIRILTYPDEEASLARHAGAGDDF
jgi:hypothetical protein